MYLRVLESYEVTKNRVSAIHRASKQQGNPHHLIS